MSINRDKPDLWKKDILQSVDLYNSWFMEFAPKAFRDTHITTANSVERALVDTKYLRDISVDLLKNHPEVLPILRMSTCPPIARDCLIGLAGVTKSLVENMEDTVNPRVSPRMPAERLYDELLKIVHTINRMADPDIFVWLSEMREPTEQEIQRSATVVADRLCGAVADPIIRNAQEKRQLAAITRFLQDRGYTKASAGTKYNEMVAGTISFYNKVPLLIAVGVILALTGCTSVADMVGYDNAAFKEEAAKMQQLKNT